MSSTVTIAPVARLRGGPSAWRTASRYRRDEAEGRAVLDALDRDLAALQRIHTPIWVFDAERCQCLWANPPGLAIWRAASVDELQRRDVASTQSEAVYVLLNDYLERVLAGERPGCWVTLTPAGTTRRSYQLHHPLQLADGRHVLLIEAQLEPPAEELLAFASNHTITVGLFELDGQLVSGNPAFAQIAEHGSIPHLDALLPPGGPHADWAEKLERQSVLTFDAELATARGRRSFRCELRRVTSHDRRPVAMLSLFDVTEERLAEAERAHGEAVERSLRQKESLLMEIHHRVKNNLQVVASLLSLQGESVGDERARCALEESAQRVTSMALVHEMLYGVGSLERIDVLRYAETLMSMLHGLFRPDAHVAVEGTSVELPIQEAVPVGLLLNELITNAFKYGVPAETDGSPAPRAVDVRVDVGCVGDDLTLCVTDRGPGLPSHVSVSTASTLGLKLVHTLARQIRAELVFEHAPSRVRLRVPHMGSASLAPPRNAPASPPLSRR